MAKYITVILVCLSAISCVKKDNIDKENSVLTIDNKPNTELQSWINNNYVTPYNIDVVYQWESKSTYDRTLLYPPKQDNVKQVLEVAERLWLNLYKKEMGEDIKDFLPIDIKLFGGVNERESGYEELSILEASPLQMTLFRVDEFKKDEEHLRKLMRNIYNNYTKLLIWKKPFDRKAFADLNWVEYTFEVRKGADIYTISNISGSGFYSLPAFRYNVEEDFAETVSIILSYPKSEIDAMIASASIPIFKNDLREFERSRKAKKTLEAKRDFVVKYFKDEYNIDLYKLSYLSQREMKEYLK